MDPIEVLLVEDNAADARLLVESLKESGPDVFRIRTAARLNAAVEALAHAPANVILLDLSLPDSSGLSTVDRMQSAAPGVPIVVLTGLQDEALALQAVRRGVQDYLIKGMCEGGLAARALRYALERRRAESALHESEERLRALSDATFDALLLHEHGRVIEVNQAFVRMFGYAADEIIGRDALSLIVEPESVPILEEKIRTGSERPYELVLRRNNGTTFPAEVRAKNTMYRGRSVRVASFHDVTERKAAEEATRSAERQLQTVMDAVPALIGFVDKDGYYRLSNRAFESWFGLAPEAVAGRHMKEVLGAAAWEKVRPRLDRALAGEEVRYDDLLPYGNGGPRWVGGSYTPSRGPAGDVQGVVVLVNDITDRKRSEEALRDSEARLRAVVDTAVDAIITIDDRGTIESTNPATERLFAYRRDEMIGRNVNMLMPEPYRSDHDAYLDRYLRSGEARIIGIGREVMGLRSDGGTVPLDLSVSEFRMGERRMFTGILHDITNRRRLEREILEAGANEQRRVGQELHDGLCQQLTGIAFAVELLVRKFRTQAPNAVPRLLKLSEEVDQAITQTRSLARGLNPVEIHADSLAPALAELSRKVAETFSIACRFRREGDAESTVGDNSAATHLYRIAQEAISNAIRHGKAKRVDLKLRSDGGSVSLSVVDDGVGFSIAGVVPGNGGKSDGIGLQTMAYRAKLINAVLDVRPGQRRGVVVTCSVPSGGGGAQRPGSPSIPGAS